MPRPFTVFTGRGIRLSCSTPGTSPPLRPSRTLLRPLRPAVGRSRPRLDMQTEDVPLDMVTGLLSRMSAAVSLPISIDLEAGYGDTPEAAAESVAKILKAGAIGINIEDGLFGGKRQLVSPDQHAAKIKAVRNAAQKLGI